MKTYSFVFLCLKQIKNYNVALSLLLLCTKIGWSFGITTKAFKSLVRAFGSQSQLNHSNHGGRPKAAPHTYFCSLALALDFVLGFEMYPCGFPSLLKYS